MRYLMEIYSALDRYNFYTKGIKDTIASRPFQALDYMYMTKKLLPGAESSIAKDAQASYQYAEHLLKGRFPLGEQVILKSPDVIVPYIFNIIKGPWLEAENMIFSGEVDPELVYIYFQNYIDQPYRKYEEYLFSIDNYLALMRYSVKYAHKLLHKYNKRIFKWLDDPRNTRWISHELIDKYLRINEN